MGSWFDGGAENGDERDRLMEEYDERTKRLGEGTHDDSDLAWLKALTEADLKRHNAKPGPGAGRTFEEHAASMEYNYMEFEGARKKKIDEARSLLPPDLTDAAVKDAKKREAAKASMGQGRRSTFLTGAQGLSTPAPLSKTFLGGGY